MNVRIVRLLAFLTFASVVAAASLVAQVPSDSRGKGAVNKAAAMRSLERSVAFLASGEWDQASFEARLGRTYDPTIADFHYVDAVCLVARDSSRSHAIESLENALAPGLEWRSYDKSSATLLCAQLYAETLRHEKALSLASSVRPHSSPEQDLVVTRALYGLGRIDEARSHLAASLDRWPFDARFPRSFYLFESKARPDAEALSLARSIASRLYLWERDDRDLLILSVPFEPDPDARARNIRVYRGMGKSDSSRPEGYAVALSAVLALEHGLVSEDAAVSELFSLSPVGIPRSLLRRFCSLVAGDRERKAVSGILADFDGVIVDDANGDGIVDARVSYRLGRPFTATFDQNQDGVPDYSVSCELGEPVSLDMGAPSARVLYDEYPFARSVTAGARVYTLFPKRLSWAPIAWVDEGLSLASEPFFVLESVGTREALTERLLFASSAYYTETVDAARGEELRVTLDGGLPVVSQRSVRGLPYERIVYSRGVPSDGSRDEDGDGYFETSMLYSRDGILESVRVDRNANRRHEYEELHSRDGTVSKRWDSDENGQFEVVWTRSSGGVERTSWIHPVTGGEVSILVEGGKPRSVVQGGKTLSIVQDPALPVWWLGAIPSSSRDFSSSVIEAFNRAPDSVVYLTVEASGRTIRAVRTGGYVFVELSDVRN